MDYVVPESQCGFRTGQGTGNMIFSARQLMKKYIEQRVPLYQVFVELTKAFDTVNRSALWIILGKLGCPPQFVEMLKQLHRNMKARVNVNGRFVSQFQSIMVCKKEIYQLPPCSPSTTSQLCFHMHFKIMTLG